MTFSLPRRDPTDALEIDSACLRAWPAQEQQQIGPWLLRASAGFTRPANCVVVSGELGDAEAEVALGEVERFYASRSLPARFRLRDHADHAELRRLLTARGYRHAGQADVVVHAGPLRVLRAAPPPDKAGRVLVGDAPSEGWFDVWWEAQPYEPSHRRTATELLWQAKGRCGFASHVRDGEVLATGLGVVDGPWLGIFCVATREDRRRQASARRILGALATWGVAHAARHAYVHFEAAHPATGAAARFGLLPVYRLGYLERPV